MEINWNNLNSAERIALHIMDVDGSESAINKRSAVALEAAGLVVINTEEVTPYRNRVYAHLTTRGIALAEAHR